MDIVRAQVWFCAGWNSWAPVTSWVLYEYSIWKDGCRGCFWYILRRSLKLTASFFFSRNEWCKEKSHLIWWVCLVESPWLFTRVERLGKEGRRHPQKRGCSRSDPAPRELPEPWRYVETQLLWGMHRPMGTWSGGTEQGPKWAFWCKPEHTLQTSQAITWFLFSHG